MNQLALVLESFCLDFLANPYQAYTEHGLHALFFAQLYNALPEEERFFNWCWDNKDIRICRIQKEYPMASDSGKSRRQHWDISIIKNPPEIHPYKTPKYDYFKLEAAIEFGMNEGKEHLEDDIERLSYLDAWVEKGIVVHLYRISEKFSGRDCSPRSRRILSPEDVLCLLNELSADNIEVHYVQVGNPNTQKNGYWHISKKDGARSMARL
jgi:hypothetical protein